VVAAPASALVVADIPVSVVSETPTPMQVDGESAPAVLEERSVKSGKSRKSQQHLAAVTANVNTYVKKGRQIIGQVVTKVPASSLRSMWDKVRTKKPPSVAQQRKQARELKRILRRRDRIFAKSVAEHKKRMREHRQAVRE